MPRFDPPIAPITLGKMRELGVRPTGCAAERRGAKAAGARAGRRTDEAPEGSATALLSRKYRFIVALLTGCYGLVVDIEEGGAR
jgi:hypothetical protein